MSELRVNVGCGKDVREGWLNVDRFPHPGVEVVNLDHDRIPLEDGKADYVLASHVLEHVIDFAATWNELHRILKIGGTLEIVVTYGVRLNPYHVRHFDRPSILLLTRQSRDIDLHYSPRNTLEEESWYDMIRMRMEPWRGFPYWHVWHYTGERLVLRRGFIHAWLRKTS